MIENLSVIIPLWNGAAFIEETLRALLALGHEIDGELEIIVVDNASTDDSASLAEKYAEIRLIRLEQNRGFAGGCNRGLAKARGEGLILLNQDTVVQPGWLAAMGDGLSLPGVGVVGAVSRYEDGRIQHAGGTIDWPLGVARHVGVVDADLEEGQNRPAEFVSGFSFGLTREVYRSVGPLDEGFWPGYYEDVDYCFRARAAGYRVIVTPNAQLIHSESASFGDGALARWARLRSRLRFCLKWMPPDKFVSEFLPAEARYREVVLAGDGDGRIARAYLEAATMLADLWEESVPPVRVNQALRGLGDLYGGPYGFEYGNQSKRSSSAPILTPSRFDRVPLLGRTWKGLRFSLHQLVIFYVERFYTEGRPDDQEARRGNRGIGRDL